MKLAKHNNALKTNVETESQNFGIGDASVVIEILRNRLYKHKIRTLVQEYISNGRDASREVKSKQNVKVVSPTVFEPTFKVRDYGVGISPDRIKNVFVMYGSSTKRDSNNQTGGFGIGAKSAWSYTDSFTIITYIDGVKRTYLAHTGVNNNGRLDFLGETSTDEPNGTEIQIGVSPDDIKKFQTSILRATHFWKEDIDLTGMDVDKSDLERGLMIDNFEVIKADAVDGYGFNGWQDDVILAIDGILYPLDKDSYRDILDTNRIAGKLVIHLDVGLIDVSASREEIAISPENDKVLKEFYRKANLAIDGYINKQINSVSTIKSKIEKVVELNEHFRVSYTAGNYRIDTNGRLSSELFTDVDLVTYSIRRGKLRKTHVNDKTRSYTHRTTNIDLENLYFFDNSESLVKRNMRIREFLETHNSITVLEFKNSNSSIYDKIKRELPFVDLKTLTYTEVAKTATTKVKRQNAEFCVHEIDVRWGLNKHHVTLATNTKVWYYVEMDGNSFPQSKSYIRDVAQLMKINVCGLSKASVKKVKGDKNFKCFNKYVKDLKPTDEQIKQIQYNLSKNSHTMNKYIDIETIKNRKLKAMAKFYQSFKNMKKTDLPVLLKDWEKNEKVLKFLKRDAEVVTILKPCTLINKISYGTIDKKEVTFYINCKLNKGVKNG